MSRANAGTVNNNNNNNSYVSRANAGIVINDIDESTANAGTLNNNKSNNKDNSLSKAYVGTANHAKNNKHACTEDKSTEDSGKDAPKKDLSTDHTPKDFCEMAVRMGSVNCGKPQCSKRHDFDQQKLQEGLCFKELKRKKSCNKGNKCKYSHQIPSSLRNDAGFFQAVVDEFKKQKSEITTISAAELAEKPTCTTEYYGGLMHARAESVIWTTILIMKESLEVLTSMNSTKKNHVPMGRNVTSHISFRLKF